MVTTAVLLIIWAFWDITPCHWESSSQHSEDLMNLQNAENYLPSDIVSHPITFFYISSQ